MNSKQNTAVQQHAARQVAKAISLFRFRQIKSWPELERALGITIDPAFTSQPFLFPAFQSWCDAWKLTALARAEGANIRMLAKAEAATKLKVADHTDTIGQVTLFPEQQTVVERIREIFWTEKSSKFVVQDGETGSGKTFVAAALCDYIIKHKLWRSKPDDVDLPYRILILTPKTVVESYKRVLELFGLGAYIGHIILVTSYSQMTSGFGSIFYKEKFDPFSDTPDEPIIDINPVFVPYFTVLDEFHRLNNQQTKQTKFALALTSGKHQPYTLAMSATPWVTVNHSRLAVLASRRSYFGMQVTNENFTLFARNICKDPAKPNIEAAKRIRAQLNDIIVSFPKVRWRSKAINQVLIVDFECQAHRKAAEDAYEIFLERKRKAGENTKFGRFEEFIALGQYRKAVEPFRVPAMVERTIADIARGKAVVIGAAFRKTIADAVFRLKKAGINRDKISVIWGGKRDWNTKMLLTDEQKESYIKQLMQGEELLPGQLRALRETLDYQTERILANETQEEQEQRLIIQRELNITGTQSAEQRQVEIDRFQSGESLVCLFTLAAGGVGLSLDQCRPELLPRVGYFTPSYSGPEFKQALGRTIRRATVSDVEQYMCYMQGTVEEYHVAPAVDRKLKCIAAITGNIFNIIDLDTAVKTNHKYRTKDEVLQDAESIESQFQNNTEDKEEDDEL